MVSATSTRSVISTVVTFGSGAPSAAAVAALTFPAKKHNRATRMTVAREGRRGPAANCVDRFMTFTLRFSFRFS
jgi:hypothetical protein